MSRIFSNSEDETKPFIDSGSVKYFFEERARKFFTGEVTYKQAVIYQDKSDSLAEERDALEKKLLLPKLGLSSSDCLLDIGCGTGRWAEVIIDSVKNYHGVDLVEELVDIARLNNPQLNAKFDCVPCTEIDLDKIAAKEPFNKVIMLGVLIYLNDGDVQKALESVVKVASKDCVFLLREPVGIKKRLTIKEHFSEDMEQFYNAIYRTADELIMLCDNTLGAAGFTLVESGGVFKTKGLNNRVETRQEYFLFSRVS